MTGRLTVSLAATLAAVVIAATACQPEGGDASSTTAPTVDGGAVGVVGCSMTLDALRGYHAVEGLRMWPAGGLNYGLGTISAWAESGNAFWDQFESMMEANPGTSEVWWQLCAGRGEDTIDNALVVLGEIQSRAPGATIHVSAQPGYTDGHVCPIAGQDGPTEMQLIADELVSDHDIEAGPDMGDLSVEVLRDNCHPNDGGRQAQGQILVEFFD